MNISLPPPIVHKRLIVLNILSRKSSVFCTILEFSQKSSVALKEKGIYNIDMNDVPYNEFDPTVNEDESEEFSFEAPAQIHMVTPKDIREGSFGDGESGFVFVPPPAANEDFEDDITAVPPFEAELAKTFSQDFKNIEDGEKQGKTIKRQPVLQRHTTGHNPAREDMFKKAGEKLESLDNTNQTAPSRKPEKGR